MAGRSWRKPPAKRNRIVSGAKIGALSVKITACSNCWQHWLETEFQCHACRSTAAPVMFDSKLEHVRGCELKRMEKAGEVFDLVRQPRFDLIADGGKKIGERWADFQYVDNRTDELVIEDVKPKDRDGNSLQDPLSAWKDKHFNAQYPYKMSYYP